MPLIMSNEPGVKHREDLTKKEQVTRPLVSF